MTILTQDATAQYPSPPKGERSDTPGRAGKRAPGGATAYMIER